MDPQRLVELQQQMRVNQSELEQYVKELNVWEEDVKKKEGQLTQRDRGEDVAKATTLPPIRNSLDKKKKQKKKRHIPSNVAAKEVWKPQRIQSGDYKSWDKFDVEKACAMVDDKEGKSSSSEYETDEEWEVERKIKQAAFLKDQGNQYFKEGKYDEAIECYTQGIECDPTNVLLPANRAMALLKQDKFAAAELDCTQAIALDPTYTKAVLRRATARVQLNKLKEAKQDITSILNTDPSNKQAKHELTRIEKLLNPPRERVGIVAPVDKTPCERSKKPMRRIQIEEIGLDKEEEEKMVIHEKVASVLATQSEAKKQTTARDEAQFDAFVKRRKDAPCNGLNSNMAETIPSNDVNNVSSNGVESVVVNTQEVSSSERCAENESLSRTNRSLPPVPTSSIQFQADWKSLRNDPDLCFQYFKKIDCLQYPKLFDQALDGDNLPRILSILEMYYITNNLDVYVVLQSLSTVKRFSMAVMFMSAKENERVERIFKHLRTTGLHSDTDIARLAKAYQS